MVSRPGLGGDAYTGAVNVQVVLVHGIRTSATMWRSQVAWLQEHEISGVAVDLPGHGTRMAEEFTLDGALQTIDQAVRDASLRGPVLLVGHSMGGLLSLAYAGGASRPPVTALIAAGCTALPRGAALAAYRFLAGAMDRLPDRGLWIAQQVLTATIPEETRGDFSAGGYALDAQDVALRSLSALDVATAVERVDIPLWFVNGQFDQLRTHEAAFRRLAPHAELIVVPRTSHLVTAMRPRVFNAVLQVAVATIERSGTTTTEPPDA